MVVVTPSGSRTTYLVPSPTRCPRLIFTGDVSPSPAVLRAGIPDAANAARNGSARRLLLRARVGPGAHQVAASPISQTTATKAVARCSHTSGGVAKRFAAHQPTDTAAAVPVDAATAAPRIERAPTPNAATIRAATAAPPITPAWNVGARIVACHHATHTTSHTPARAVLFITSRFPFGRGRLATLRRRRASRG